MSKTSKSSKQFKFLSSDELEKMSKHTIKSYRSTIYREISRNRGYYSCECCGEFITRKGEKDAYESFLEAIKPYEKYLKKVNKYFSQKS